jgi:uncharacterized protein YkwD
MNFKHPLTLSVFLLTASAPGAEPYQPPASPTAETQLLTAEAAQRALEMLSSPNAGVRTKAATALRQRSLSIPSKTQAREIFRKARTAHLRSLDVLVKRGVPTLGQIKISAETWTAKCTAVMALIQTDYHKEADKVAMLSREHETTEKLRKGLDKELSTAMTAWKPIADATTPLAQLDREMELLEDLNAGFSPKKPETYLKELGSATDLLRAMELVLDRQKAAEQQAAVLKHNESCKWATKPTVTFAAILNSKRASMNLPPLRLDQALSDAASGHSKEMQAMGYFAHESPVAANKSPADRAKNAKFDGGLRGENIFMGSPGASEAYGAWWGSDGHRFIMFSSGPNTLGVGPVATYWTMMTGQKNWGE